MSRSTSIIIGILFVLVFILLFDIVSICGRLEFDFIFTEPGYAIDCLPKYVVEPMPWYGYILNLIPHYGWF